VTRIDGPDKVTGRAPYAADVPRPGLLWGKVLRSPLAHARIVAIDTSRARALAGVHAVLTGADPHVGRVGRQMRELRRGRRCILLRPCIDDVSQPGLDRRLQRAKRCGTAVTLANAG
jgi:CO/xanthine dehydrogenase Mo-binding subunit